MAGGGRVAGAARGCRGRGRLGGGPRGAGREMPGRRAPGEKGQPGAAKNEPDAGQRRRAVFLGGGRAPRPPATARPGSAKLQHSLPVQAHSRRRRGQESGGKRRAPVAG